MIYNTRQGDFIHAKKQDKGLLLAGMMVMMPERLSVHVLNRVGEYRTSYNVCAIIINEEKM